LLQRASASNSLGGGGSLCHGVCEGFEWVMFRTRRNRKNRGISLDPFWMVLISF
jgi:hypothetical protein